MNNGKAGSTTEEGREHAVAPGMNSTVTAASGYDLLALAGEIDLHYSPQLREKSLASLKAGRPLLIDMSRVEYIDSSGIAALVEGFQTAKSAGLAYGLLDISKNAMQVLALTRLDKIFALYTSADQFQQAL